MKTLSKLFNFMLLTFIATLFSCKDSQDSDSVKPYDSSIPIKITTFYPDSGGMATKVIINGENFGNDPSQIKVYYNDLSQSSKSTRAAVVKTIGNKIYVITPKQPGDKNSISVVVGKDSVVSKMAFKYTTQIRVSTIAGKLGANNVLDGTLAEAEFHHPRYLTVDKEGNIFVSEFHDHALRHINEEKNIVETLLKNGGLANPNAPAIDPEGKVVFVPNDGGNVMFEFDPELQWAPKRISPRKDPTSNDFKIDYKHSIVASVLDGLMYTRAYNGQLIKFNGRTKAAWLVDTDLMPNSDSYLVFHPIHKELLYICYAAKSCIYTYNTKTGEHKLFAGQINQHGWLDGEADEALFNHPRQICFDIKGNLYVADGLNHVIRKVSPEGIVSTVVGIAGVKGYRDGSPDEAMFNQPDGVAIDEEGTIYIADYENRLIRKLSIE